MVIDFNRPNSSTLNAPNGRGAVQGNERTGSPCKGRPAMRLKAAIRPPALLTRYN